MNRILVAWCVSSTIFCWGAREVRAQAVVTDGRFTNVYVYPGPSKETWDEHLTKLPANQKPKNWEKFTRKLIDEYTQTLMSTSWPSYFSGLKQYGINPPQFFGGYIASQSCVDAAIRDAHNGIVAATSLRSLANCHIDGMDTSPQVNLILSPDMKVAEGAVVSNGPDICGESGNHTVAYHGAGLNVPNYSVMPTARGCAPNFGAFTANLSHEIVEIVTDPALLGHGGIPSGNELGD